MPVRQQPLDDVLEALGRGSGVAQVGVARVAGLNIPTGIPLVYRLDEDMQPVRRGGEYLDPEAAKDAIAAVANQGR